MYRPLPVLYIVDLLSRSTAIWRLALHYKQLPFTSMYFCLSSTCNLSSLHKTKRHLWKIESFLVLFSESVLIKNAALFTQDAEHLAEDTTQAMGHIAPNGSVHTGCTQHQRVCMQIGVQICLGVLCEPGLRLYKIELKLAYFSIQMNGEMCTTAVANLVTGCENLLKTH